jgi:hypothetical protein
VQRVSRTAGLCSELPSCEMRCNPALEEDDYEVVYVLYRRHPLNFQYPVDAEPLVFFLLSDLAYPVSSLHINNSPAFSGRHGRK